MKPKTPRPIEYTSPNGHPWKAEAGESLLAQFGLPEAELPAWHTFMAGQPAAVQQFLRMLYGVNPLLPSVEGNTDAVRLFSATEIMRGRGWKKSTFNEYLDALVDQWRNRSGPAAPGLPGTATTPEGPTGEAPATEAPAQAPEDDLATIKSFGFSPSIFELEDRDELQKQSEIQWFAARLRDLKKMFEEPMAMGLARQAVINEMLLRRCDDQMTRVSPRNKEFALIQSTKIEIEKIYQDQWSQLEEICPFVKAITNKVSFSASVSDIIEGYRDFLATDDAKKMDGLFNWYAIQILTRGSVQEPTMRYRLGWVLANLEAKEGLCVGGGLKMG